MIFKPGDLVQINGKGPVFVVQRSNAFSYYPLEVDGCTYTEDGRVTRDSLPKLTLFVDKSIKFYPLGKVLTLDNGIQIYHPNKGQPFQLIQTTKELLC